MQPHKKMFYFLILVIATLAVLALATEVAENFPGSEYRIEIKK